MDKHTALYILGLKDDSTNLEIKKRFKELAKKIHPDVENGDELLFIVIKESYDFLLASKQLSCKPITYTYKEDIVTKKRREYKQRETAPQQSKGKTRIHFENIPEPINDTEKINNKDINVSKSSVVENKDIQLNNQIKSSKKVIKNAISIQNDKNKTNENNNISKNTDSNIKEEKNINNYTNSINIEFDKIIKEYSIEFTIKDLQELAKNNKISKYYDVNGEFYEVIFSSMDVFYNKNRNFFLKDTLTVKINGQTKQFIIKKEISMFISNTITIDIPFGYTSFSCEFGTAKKNMILNKRKKKLSIKTIALANDFPVIGNEILDLDTIMLKIILK